MKGEEQRITALLETWIYKKELVFSEIKLQFVWYKLLNIGQFHMFEKVD